MDINTALVIVGVIVCIVFLIIKGERLLSKYIEGKQKLKLEKTRQEYKKLEQEVVDSKKNKCKCEDTIKKIEHQEVCLKFAIENSEDANKKETYIEKLTLLYSESENI